MKKNLCLLLFGLAFCKGKPPAAEKAAEVLTASESNKADATAAAFSLADFFASSPRLDSAVEARFAALSNDERAAQMIMHATSEQNGAALPFAKAKDLYAKGLIGGVLFLKGDVKVFQKQIRLLDSVSRKQNRLPPAYACDCEPTLYHKKFLGVDSVPPAPNLKDSGQVIKAAQTIATNIKAMGIGINFAPVADVALNKEVINKRSFGTVPADVIAKSTAFVKATQSLNVVSAVKHFPGHGAVKGDTHKGQVTIQGELTELATFQKIIAQSQPVMVMVGHMSVAQNKDYGTAGRPCTLAEVIATKLLKGRLNYRGIVITDAMRMQAVKAVPDADWKAVQAGADVVLIPINPVRLHGQISRALRQNEMKKGLEASVKKVLRMKICLGLL